MKRRIFTFLLIAVTALSACKKDKVDQNIHEYDQQQIENYMSANGLTDFKRDTTDGDTTGMYYKIINKGTGPALEYSDDVSLVYTVRSMDGKYVLTDTIVNHVDEFLGHLTFSTQTRRALPKGLQLAIKNVLKYRDGSMRLLVPSHLAYGTAGFSTGSVTNANARLAGNQSLDYYIHVINDQQVYDDLVIRNYMTANNLSGYNKTSTGLYYKIITPGTGSVGSITDFSTVTTTYTGALLNNAFFDQGAKTTATSFTVGNLVLGVKEGLKGYASAGTSISLLVPSRLGYGAAGSANSIITAHCPLRFEFQITTVTQP
jgi:FKBP-type peptidyl-prolyl cis-trans isomerase FkpA